MAAVTEVIFRLENRARFQRKYKQYNIEALTVSILHLWAYR